MTLEPRVDKRGVRWAFQAKETARKAPRWEGLARLRGGQTEGYPDARSCVNQRVDGTDRGKAGAVEGSLTYSDAKGSALQ